MITYNDMLTAIIRSLDDFRDHYDVDAICDEIHDKWGLCDIEIIPTDVYWEVVSRHAL